MHFYLGLRPCASGLNGVSLTDPLTFALIAALLGAALMLACFMQARRATKVYPVAALKRD